MKYIIVAHISADLNHCKRDGSLFMQFQFMMGMLHGKEMGTKNFGKTEYQVY